MAGRVCGLVGVGCRSLLAGDEGRAKVLRSSHVSHRLRAGSYISEGCVGHEKTAAVEAAVFLKRVGGEAGYFFALEAGFLRAAAASFLRLW